jgi:hypothetical protein
MRKKCLPILFLLCGSLGAAAQLATPAGNKSAPARVVIEFSAVECTLAPGKNTGAALPPNYKDIQQLPADSVRVLDSASGPGANTPFFVRHVAGSASAKPKPDAKDFAPGETGTIAEAEVVVGGQPAMCDVNINYKFRMQLDAHDPKSLQEITFTTSFATVPEKPCLLNLSAVQGHEGTFIAIIATVHLADAGGKSTGESSKGNNPP